MSKAEKKTTEQVHDEIHRLSTDVRFHRERSEKFESEWKKSEARNAELVRQRDVAIHEAEAAKVLGGRLTAEAGSDLEGGFQLRFARDFTAGTARYPQGLTAGVLVPKAGLPLDFIADGLRNGVLRAEPIATAHPNLSKDPPAASGKGDEPGKKGKPEPKGGPDDEPDGNEVPE